MSDPIQLVPNRPDSDIAAELRRRFEQAYNEHIIPLFNEAAQNQFIVQVSVQMGPFGRMVIQQIQIMKQY